MPGDKMGPRGGREVKPKLKIVSVEVQTGLPLDVQIDTVIKKAREISGGKPVIFCGIQENNLARTMSLREFFGNDERVMSEIGDPIKAVRHDGDNAWTFAHEHPEEVPVFVLYDEASCEQDFDPNNEFYKGTEQHYVYRIKDGITINKAIHGVLKLDEK